MRLLKKIYNRVALNLSGLIVPRDRVTVRHTRACGFEILVRANEDVGRQIAFLGNFESDEAAFFESYIKPDHVCVDAGGNVGFFSMLFAKCAALGTVHVFEPIPLNASLIRASADLNAFENVTINNVALGDTLGMTDFSVSIDSAYSSMHATGRRKESQNIRVPVWTLDTYLEEKGIQKIDLMKVDVEGAEEMVILGGAKTLSDPDRRPSMVLLELFDPNLIPFGTSMQAIIDRMIGFGYTAKVLETKDCLVPYNPSTHASFYNIFFAV